MLGETSRPDFHSRAVVTNAISAFLQPYVYASTFRLDPVWDPLRADPAFRKLCEEKQPDAAKLFAEMKPR